jgi:hypothetical protein
MNRKPFDLENWGFVALAFVLALVLLLARAGVL